MKLNEVYVEQKTQRNRDVDKSKEGCSQVSNRVVMIWKVGAEHDGKGDKEKGDGDRRFRNCVMQKDVEYRGYCRYFFKRRKALIFC